MMKKQMKKLEGPRKRNLIFKVLKWCNLIVRQLLIEINTDACLSRPQKSAHVASDGDKYNKHAAGYCIYSQHCYPIRESTTHPTTANYVEDYTVT